MGLLLLALVACGKGEADWKKVEAGMSEADVADILGKPSKKKGASDSASVAGTIKAGTKWHYGKDSFVVFASGSVSAVTFRGKILVAPASRGGGLGSGSIGD
jgi:hypothetical protein